jgi:hypothetical protein
LKTKNQNNKNDEYQDEKQEHSLFPDINIITSICSIRNSDIYHHSTVAAGVAQAHHPCHQMITIVQKKNPN